jgi:hypothetical protein
VTHPAGPRARPATRGHPRAPIASLATRPYWRASCAPCQTAAFDSGDATTTTTEGGSMDRQAWLDQRRAAVLASYDQDAAAYDDHG